MFNLKTNVYHTSWYISLLTSHLRFKCISKDRFVISDHRNFDFIESTHRESLVLILRLLLQVKVCSFRKSLNITV